MKALEWLKMPHIANQQALVMTINSRGARGEK